MRLATLLLLAILLCTSCGGDDDPKEGNCLTATINGEEFVAETTTGTAITTTVNWGGLGDQETQSLTIIGTIPSVTGDTRTISLVFACSEFTSELDYVDTDAACGVGMDYSVTSFLDPNSSTATIATAGTISIEEVSADHIKGTFTFSGEDQNGVTYNITDGFFDTDINM